MTASPSRRGATVGEARGLGTGSYNLVRDNPSSSPWLEVAARRRVDDLAVRVEPRAVTGQSQLFSWVFQPTTQPRWGADGRAFVRRTRLVAVDGNLRQTASDERSAPRRNLVDRIDLAGCDEVGVLRCDVQIRFRELSVHRCAPLAKLLRVVRTFAALPNR